MDRDIFLHPFALGFYLGMVFVALVLYRNFKLKREMARFRRYLSDKLEVEADAVRKTRDELDTLRKENESLRVRMGTMSETPERKLSRDLEIFARAEKRMFLNVPGFAPAWETAKSEAHKELVEEENGRSAPKRIFNRLFGGGGGSKAALAEPKAEEPESP